MDRYILVNGQPVREPNLLRFAEWFESTDADQSRRVARTQVDAVVVSTVFLGYDHGWGRGAPPVLWETMAFNGNDAQDYLRRYASREEALAGHREAVLEVFGYDPDEQSAPL